MDQPKYTSATLHRDLSSIEVRVALLEQTSQQLNILFSKLDQTIDKLTDVSSSIKELVAVHETKIKQIDVLADEIHDVEASIYREIEKLTNEEKTQHAVLNNKLDSINTSFNKRIGWFERARWLIIGGGVVIGFILSQIEYFHKLFEGILK